jgi:hypothetical protein
VSPLALCPTSAEVETARVYLSTKPDMIKQTFQYISDCQQNQTTPYTFDEDVKQLLKYLKDNNSLQSFRKTSMLCSGGQYTTPTMVFPLGFIISINVVSAVVSSPNKLGCNPEPTAQSAVPGVSPG